MPTENDTSAKSQLPDAKQLIALEEELIAVKKQYGIVEKTPLWVSVGDRISRATAREKVPVNRKRYINLALSCGWFCGSHRFYSKRPVLGILYLLFFWTGIPFAMTLIDLMIVLPMQADETGTIFI